MGPSIDAGQTHGLPWVDPPMGAQPICLDLSMGPAHSFYAIMNYFSLFYGLCLLNLVF